MLKVNKVHQAVLCALSASTVATTVHAQAIEEIVVTATKRAANMQDIPIAVQAMGSQRLEEENIQSFVDYVKYLPSVNAGGRGPGQNEIYIRGAAVDAINITVAESQGSAPNVALYLDEQPVTAGGRNLDVYISDMERIEVLPGPQGTLYGASSMAGTVRLITNKPVLDEFSASFNGSWSKTDGGEDSNSVEAMFNVPLVDGKMAFRAALYSDSQGGYIDNIEGNFQASHLVNPTFPGTSVTYAEGHKFANGTVVQAGGMTVPVIKDVANNASSAEDDFNDAHYAGARLGLKWLLNDNWDLLVQHTQQALKTEGVFDYDLDKGDLKVSRYTPDKLDDAFTQTAWTLTGSIRDLDIVYTGAYLDRSVEAQLDYTGYTNIGAFISGYQCEYLVGGWYTGDYTMGSPYTWDPTLGGDPGVIECGTPANAVHLDNEMTRLTNEVRFNTNFDGMLNFSGGFFFEDFEIKHIGDFNYLAPYQQGWNGIDINRNSTFANSAANARGWVTAGTQFRNDNLRTENQTAIFGEVNFELTDAINLTAGFRKYDLEYDFQGYGAWRYGNRPIFVDDNDATNDIRPNVTGGRDYATNFTGIRPLNVDDTLMKFTASFTPNDDTLIYATFSEGYRPGGFNRAAAKAGAYNAAATNETDSGLVCGDKAAINSHADGFPGYCLPYAFRSDTLKNMEVGLKTTILDGRLRFNGAFYSIDWEDIQVSQFDSQHISILTVVDNGGDAEITGFEGDFTWAATDNLSLYGAFSRNDTELIRVDPAFAMVVMDAGRPLPLTPELQYSVRARYEWERGVNNYHVQAGFRHAGKALNSIVDTTEEPNTWQKAYTVADASLGLNNSQDNWGLEIFIKNLTDERAQLHINRQDFFERVTTNRPRTVGLRLSYDF
tara:strand:- start:362 stop:3025 length:2664 start_codon:yes stop_codon:yes gene_type:complete